MHADWILAAAMLPNGPRPHLYFIAVPAEQAIVVDTSHMDGMIGTCSNDIVMRGSPNAISRQMKPMSPE